MALTSFSIKKTLVGKGSYLQKDSAQDGALRSDAFVSAGLATGDENTFSANVIDQNSVLLSWELSFSLFQGASSATTQPIALEIVASPTGEPITPKDGSRVITITSNDVSSYDDQVRVSQGRWVYYSLFVKYLNSGLTWYERVATLYIQIPIEHKSINNLWSRIPPYYRQLDDNQEGNPLYNFLELFGWEIDRTRTLIETIALSNDPDLAVTPALQELAYETGLEIDPVVYGTTKARALLQNIGYLRRRKGTQQSISEYISALTGCQVTYNYNPASASATYNFKVHTQRINFVSDPIFKNALPTPVTGTSPLQTIKISNGYYGVYCWSTGTTGASVSTSGSQLTISTGASAGTTTAVVYANKAFPYHKEGYLYTAFETNVAGASYFSNFWIASNGGASAPWESTTAGASANASGYTTKYNSNTKLSPENAGNRLRIQLAPNGTGTTTETLYPALYFTLPASSTITLSNWIVEPYSIGEYFDGNSRDGSLIPTLSGAGTGTSDYRWENNTPYTSFSYYMLDYKRMFDTLGKIVKDYLAPVTIRNKVQIDFNHYYGKT